MADSQPQPLDRSAGRKNHRARRTAAKWIRRAIVGAVVAGIAGALVYNLVPKPVVVETAVARRGPLAVTVEEDGKTRVHDRFVVAAPIAGSLARVALEAGDAVAAGQVVARIRPPDPALLDPRSRDEATARLAAALAQERAAAATVVRAKAARDQSARDAARTRRLAESGAVTANELERAELADQLARADVGAAEQQQAAAASAVVAARAVLGQGSHAGDAIDVIAPAPGRVFRVVRESAGPVAAGAPLLELGDPHVLEAVIDVLSSDAAKIAVGMPCAIAAWGGDGELAGTVARIEPSAFTHISALGVEEQRVNIVVAIPDPPAALGDGFRIEGKIVLWSGEALTVPGSATFRDRGAWAVYAVQDGRARLVRVELGRRGGVDVEIARGLAPGATVVLHPGDAIADGVRVAPAR